jgi:type I restriction enzyme, S subunit
MSNKVGERGLVPKLRFPEFREVGEWEEKRLEDVAPLQRGFDLPSDQIKPGDIPVVYSNGIQSFHSMGMARGPGLVTGRSGTIGNIHFIEEGDYWPHNTSLWVTSFKGNLPKFVYYLYISIGISRFASGSGVPTLNRNYVHAFQACLPRSVSEQQKIADCLASLDDVIALEAQKLDTLKTHKKGLMQQLFPAEGETLPKLRFPEFRDAGEWGEENLDGLVHFQDGFAFKSTDFVKSKEDATQVVRITDINNKNSNEDKVYVPDAFLELNNLGKYTVDNGDLLLSLTGAAGFNFFFWDGGRAVINQRTAKVTPKKKSDYALARLLEPLVHEKINARGEGQNNNLSKEFLSSMVLLIPEPAEQQKIASCLASLDALIIAQTQKLAALKTHKKGLMQQLFPVLDGVPA